MILSLLKIFGFSLLAGIAFTFIKRAIKGNPSSWLVEIVQNFLGSLFLFSGFIKAVDPLGTAYKMKDYFDAFGSFTGINFDWLASTATFQAVFMIILEIVLGTALIVGWKKKFTLPVTAAMMIFFTILTGFTYLTGFVNPDYYDLATRHELQAAGENIQVWTKFDERQMKVTDCGCFGDFLKLAPKVSFFKDIFILLVFSVLIFGRKHIQPFLSGSLGWIKIGSVTLFSLIFCFSNYIWGLPVFDFRPYKIGNNIPIQRVAERDAVIEYNFIYKNNDTGEEREVIASEISSLEKGKWSYVDRVDNVIDAGIPAKINNFAAFDEDGHDLTDEILANPDYSLWVLSKSLKKSDKDSWEDLQEVSDYAETNNLKMFAFMASDFDEADEFRHEMQAAYPFYQADETFIKTVVRANPGLVLLKNGNVMGKWHHNNIPSFQEIENYIDDIK